MAKKDNQKIVATDDQRRMAHNVTEARQYAKGWKERGDAFADALKGSAGLDVTLFTQDGKEVASITESEPSVSYDYEAYFAANPAALVDLQENYAKPATTRVTLTTKWVEPSRGVADPPRP